MAEWSRHGVDILGEAWQGARQSEGTIAQGIDILAQVTRVGLVAPATALLMAWQRGSPLLFTVVFASKGVYNTSVDLAHTNFLSILRRPATGRSIKARRARW